MSRRARVRPPAAMRQERGRLHWGGAWLGPLILVVVTIAVYAGSFRGVLAGDDVDAIAGNPHIRSLTPLREAATAPPDTTVAGRPVIAVSLALNYELAPADVRDVWTPPAANGEMAGADDPVYRNLWGYHALNLAVHVGVALLLFAVLVRTLMEVANRHPSAPGRGFALAVALLWSLHPIQTASVTYIVQRAESVMTLCLLLTLYASIRSLGDERRRLLWIVMAVGACAIGMGAKETMVVAPVIVAFWIHLFRPADLTSRSGIALLAGLAATWLLLIPLVASGARTASVGLDLGGWTPVAYLRTQMSVIVHYLRQVLVPNALVFAYDWPRVEAWSSVLWQTALLIALGVATVVGLIRRHPLSFAGVVFFLVLAPSSSVLPIVTEVAAEHRMYLPSAAVIAIVVAIVSRMLVARPMPQRIPIAATLVGLTAIGLGAQTAARNHDYRSAEALMTDTMRKRPADMRPRVLLGGQLLGQERFSEAERVLREAVVLPAPPDRPGLAAVAEMYLGAALAAQGRTTEGITHLERALVASPSLDEAYGMLGEAYLQQGRTVEAARTFRSAADRLPEVLPILDRAARLSSTSNDAQARDGAAAVRYAEQAARLTSRRDLQILDTLAAAYAEQGRFADAELTVREAMALARAAADASAMNLFAQRLQAYQAGRPLRER